MLFSSRPILHGPGLVPSHTTVPPTIGATCARPRGSLVRVNTSYDPPSEANTAGQLEYLKQQVAEKNKQLNDQNQLLINKDKAMRNFIRAFVLMGFWTASTWSLKHVTTLTPELVVGAVTMFEAAHYASKMLTIIVDAVMDWLPGPLDSASMKLTSVLDASMEWLWGRLG